MAREPIGYGNSTKIRKSWLDPKFVVLGILGCGLLLLPLYWLRSHSPFRVSRRSSPSSSTSRWLLIWSDGYLPTVPAPDADQLVYPYSVIPGGVTSGTQLRTALRRDPLLAAHYRNFQTHSARVIRLASQRHVYVSYRMAGRIYWTRKKVTLYAGETLLSDGTHLARTRCGNRISEAPAEPTSPSEPPSEVLNTPVSPRLPIMSPAPSPEEPLWANEYPPFPLGPGSTPQAPGGDVPFVPLFPLVPCCGGSSGPTPSSALPSSPLPQPASGPSPLPSPVPQPFPGPLPPPVATPEPRSVVLLAIGLAGLLFLWRFRRF
jgi:hypothetical protein